MKKVLLSAASFLAVIAMNAQVAKTPFIEHFTQASCGPCASQNPALKTTLDTYGTANYVKIAHQVSWPGFDPMYNSFPAGPDDRRNHYGITGVPNTVLNGGAPGSSASVVTAGTLSGIAAQTTPYEVVVTHVWNGTDIDFTVTVNNTTAAAVSSADKIFVSMVENTITYSSAPGSNGEVIFYNVMREMYNASTGATGATAGTALASIPANGTLTFNHTITPPSYIAGIGEISMVAYIQSSTGNDIEQAGKSAASLPAGALDVTASSTSTAGAGYCNYAFTPSIQFTNNGTTVVTDVTAEYTINSGTAVSQPTSGLNLAQGQSTTITFPATTLAQGISNVDYAVTDVNSGGVIASPGTIAMATETYAKLNSTPSTNPTVADFQGLAFGTAAPAGAVADNPNAIDAFTISSADAGLTQNLGGHGTSDGCFFWDYYSISAGESSKIVFEKMDLTNTTNNQLVFTHASAPYGSEADQLIVSISTDCGNTWTSVWDKSGAALNTAPASSARFWPATTEWVTNTVDISAYDNAADVMIAFEGVSAYGNSLFIDDINTTNIITGVNSIANSANNLQIVPNPVVNNMNVTFTTENAEANITIKNVQGQVVRNVSKNTVKGANTLKISTSDLSAGVYFLSVSSETNFTTQRFVVNK
jgi:hypothetical protein